MLNKFDTNNSGTLNSQEMQQVMLMTKLDQSICAKAWELSNPNHMMEFSKPMFFIAMHILFKKRIKPDIQLPD